MAITLAALATGLPEPRSGGRVMEFGCSGRMGFVALVLAVSASVGRAADTVPNFLVANATDAMLKREFEHLVFDLGKGVELRTVFFW
ncbi:MAG: hypothetical protein WCI50_13140 [Actinomycetes bacterium]